MKSRHFIFVCLFLLSTSIHAQSAELLEPVSPGQWQRLQEYNSRFLLRELYAAARHRIVAVNTELLLQDEPITLTPFDDVGPITISPERIRRSENRVTWQGRIEVDPAVHPFDVNYFAHLSMHWYDVNPQGEAERSRNNRFRFSRAWSIDENDRPVLAPPGQDAVVEAIGPPPNTPAEIAEHKRLLQLDRFAFASFATVLRLPAGRTFVVAPLRLTPRYSVVYEVDPDLSVPMPFEAEDAARMTEEARARVEQYRAFMRSNPYETDKAIVGDIR